MLNNIKHEILEPKYILDSNVDLYHSDECWIPVYDGLHLVKLLDVENVLWSKTYDMEVL